MNSLQDKSQDINKKIGQFRVIKQIGIGGMGVVYLAEREDGNFKQQVAVKLIRRGIDSQEITRRFQNERQILARLQHPNIAMLYDGGLTEDGLPYFAMEYVDGKSINNYCDDKKLTIENRLKLFQKVCTAVQYAHSNLLIHRDLKPDNILVTEAGEVKLLDFGIAKVLSTDNEAGAEILTLTQSANRVMTPEYASPEQVQGKNVITSTDVYSLGVILYELLTGIRPYFLNYLTSGQIEKTISTTVPDKPSKVFNTINVFSKKFKEETPDTQTISALRNSQPERLKKELAGDLDNICLKGLHKDTKHRYASVEQLSNDISSYLQKRPVKARPSTLKYRSQKFIQRNTIRLAMAGIVFLIINSLIVFYTVRLASERNRAQAEAQKAKQVSSLLTGLFEFRNPERISGETITARKILDIGASKIEAGLSLQPEMSAKMLHVIGEVYYSIGLYDKAKILLNQTLDLRREILDENHPDIAVTLHALGKLYESVGKYQDAAITQRAVVKILRQHSEEKAKELANSLHSFAHAQMRLYQLDEAEQLIRETLDIKRKEYGEIHAQVAYSLNILGDIHSYQNRGADAEIIHRLVLDMRRELLGNDHPDIAVTLHNLAASLRIQNKNAEAEVVYREALIINKMVFGENHTEVANVLTQLGVVVRRQGRSKESAEIQLQAINLFRKIFDHDHPRLANSLANYGRALYDEERYDEAEKSYRDAIGMKRRLIIGKNDNPSIMYWLANLGRVIIKQKNYQEAERILMESLQLSNNPKIDRENYKDIIHTYLVDLYEAWGRSDLADKYK